MTEYNLFMDESGDHGLTTIVPEFPVFLLCGVLVSQSDYETIKTSMNAIKSEHWDDKKVIFHSRDIRKQEKEFVKLFDMDVKQKFYNGINQIITDGDYTIIASGVRKDRYIKTYGKLSNDVYELSLSFIIERTVFCLDAKPNGQKKVNIIIEKRGKKEDKRLAEHFQRLIARGTGYVSAERLRAYNMSIEFVGKTENINGLQLADLIAYPMARYVIDPTRANPAFEMLEDKIYQRAGKRYGLKVFP